MTGENNSVQGRAHDRKEWLAGIKAFVARATAEGQRLSEGGVRPDSSPLEYFQFMSVLKQLGHLGGFVEERIGNISVTEQDEAIAGISPAATIEFSKVPDENVA